MDTRKIRVPYQGKGYEVAYKVETIDLNADTLPFLNVYAVFVDDPELQKIVGAHFTILHHSTQIIKPVYEIRNTGDIEEQNLKKQIAQQIMNNPSE